MNKNGPKKSKNFNTTEMKISTEIWTKMTKSSSKTGQESSFKNTLRTRKNALK